MSKQGHGPDVMLPVAMSPVAKVATRVALAVVAEAAEVVVVTVVAAGLPALTERPRGRANALMPTAKSMRRTHLPAIQPRCAMSQIWMHQGLNQGKNARRAVLNAAAAADVAIGASATSVLTRTSVMAKMTLSMKTSTTPQHRRKILPLSLPPGQ